MKLQLMKAFTYFTAVLLLCIGFIACEKEDIEESSLTSTVNSDFYRHKKAGGDEYKNFVLDFLAQVDDSIPFTGNFVATYGLPQWDLTSSYGVGKIPSLIVPVYDEENSALSSLLYFVLENGRFDYYLLMNDRDDIAYEKSKGLIQYYELALGLERSNTDFFIKIDSTKGNTKAYRAQAIECYYYYVGTIDNPYQVLHGHSCSSSADYEFETDRGEWNSNLAGTGTTEEDPKPANGGGGGGGDTPNPEDPYKYPEGTDYETKYPKLTDYLKNQVSKITLNERIMLALQGYGQFTDKQIQDILNWGDGPIIEILDISSVFNKDAYGIFSPQTSNKLYLDKSLADKMESSSGIKSEALLFLVAVTILHETVHLGDFNFDNKKWEFEAGNTFERYVYGEMIDEGNAQKHLELWIAK